MNRRDFILTTSTGAIFAAGGARAETAKMQMPWEWTGENGLARFLQVDTAPLENEFEKYPRCPYCGMMRKAWSHSRHLIVYDDDSVDATCSIHCAGISLSLNMDRGPKTIYAGEMTYVINSAQMGTMSKVSKWAYADAAKAEAAAAEAEGAKLVGFDDALREAFAGMAEDTIAIRMRRAEKRAKAAAASE